MNCHLERQSGGGACVFCAVERPRFSFYLHSTLSLRPPFTEGTCATQLMSQEN